MRINFKYGAAVGILAAAVGMLGPMAVQAGQTHGTSLPAGARAVSLQAPATHLSGISGRPVVLTSMIDRSARQQDIGIAQRENKGLANGREQFGLPGQQNRTLGQNYRCRYGYDGYGYGYDGYGYDGRYCDGYDGYGYGGYGGYDGYGYGGYGGYDGYGYGGRHGHRYGH